MYLPRPSESNFRPVPAGTWPAICYRVVDLGTQESIPPAIRVSHLAYCPR
jgi:hypothetical protein